MLYCYVFVGFAEARKGCCQTRKTGTVPILCDPKSPGTCRNASQYVFWDDVHLSQATNQMLAESMLLQGISLIWRGYCACHLFTMALNCTNFLVLELYLNRLISIVFIHEFVRTSIRWIFRHPLKYVNRQAASKVLNERRLHHHH